MYVPYDTQIWSEIAKILQVFLGVPLMIGLLVGIIIWGIRVAPSIIRFFMSFFSGG